MQRTIQYDLRIQKSTHDRMLILKYEHIELIYQTSKKNGVKIVRCGYKKIVQNIVVRVVLHIFFLLLLLFNANSVNRNVYT